MYILNYNSSSCFNRHSLIVLSVLFSLLLDIMYEIVEKQVFAPICFFNEFSLFSIFVSTIVWLGLTCSLIVCSLYNRESSFI